MDVLQQSLNSARQGSGFATFVDLASLSPDILGQMRFPPRREESRLWTWSLADGSVTREVSGARRGIAQPSQGRGLRDPDVQPQPVCRAPAQTQPNSLLQERKGDPAPALGQNL